MMNSPPSPSYKSLRRITVAMIVTLLLISLPTIMKNLMSPSGDKENKETEVAFNALEVRKIEDKKIKIVNTENLSIMGNNNILGYVNMLDSKEVIYLKPYRSKTGFLSDIVLYSYVATHEYAHILQKRLIAKTSSSAYEQGVKLLELNTLLNKNAPAVEQDTINSSPLLFIGLETNADCIVQSYTPNTEKFTYLKDLKNRCDNEQLAQARSIKEGEWPTEQNVEKWKQINKEEEHMKSLEMPKIFTGDKGIACTHSDKSYRKSKTC